MNEKLNIPQDLKIGFNKRNDTYSGLLSFITYPLPDGTNKHKNAWETWRDKKLSVMSVLNEPTEGFVINKREGGGGSWSYNDREAKIRVWDPRGFEFEITIENMLDILAQCGSIPGKGIEGKFVYGWNKLRLHLIPIKSETYKISAQFTELNQLSIENKDLVVGALYITKSMENVIYMGEFTWVNLEIYQTSAKIKKERIFYFPECKSEFESFRPIASKDLARCLESATYPNLAYLMDQMNQCGKIFTKDLIKIEKANLKFDWFNRMFSTGSSGVYEIIEPAYYQDVFWIKEDDSNFYGVRLLYLFPPRKAYNEKSLPLGVQMVYAYKLTISDDEVELKKCSKKDRKVYEKAEISQNQFYSIHIDGLVAMQKQKPIGLSDYEIAKRYKTLI